MKSPVSTSLRSSTKRRARLSTVATDQLASALQQGSLGAFEAKSEYAGALMPLLQALGWRGSMRELAEALPHFADTLELNDLRNILASLGYKTISRALEAGDELDERLFPNLLIESDGNVKVLTTRDGADIQLFDCRRQQTFTVAASELSGKVYLVTLAEDDEITEKETKDNWAASVLRRFKSSLWQLLTMTFILNLMSLIVPLFIMTLYDQVIPSHSIRVLGWLGVGLLLAFGFETVIRLFRAKLIAFVGARIEHTVAVNAFRQILHLPANMTETAPLGSQVARIRGFDGMRDIFTSVLATVILELPFVLIFIGVIAWLGGMLALIPIVMALLFAVVWFTLGPSLKRAVATASTLKATRHSFLVEAISNMRALKELSAETVWLERYRELSATTSVAHHKTAQLSFVFQSIAQSIMMIAGLSAIVGGVMLVLAGDLTIGGMIAISALIWRVLSPVQNLFLTLARATQIKVSIGQVNQLMRMQNEDDGSAVTSGMERHWDGEISLQRVSFRYHQLAEPALLGVTLDIKPGEMIAVSGPNGAGKSSILRLILSLHRPQAGQITIDGLDIRQINPAQFRQAVAYVPQQVHLFHGTIAQNLRLANPVASDEDLISACRLSGLEAEVNNLPDGLNTRIGDQAISQLNAGFKQKLSLARAYVKKASIILMDEPAMMLDNEGDAALMDALRTIKGSATIIMISHRPSHIKIADKLVLMNQGTIAAMGPPEAVMEQIPGGLG